MKKIAYVLASYPVLSETFVGTEMRNMQLCGHDIQPIAFHRHEGQYQEQDQALKDNTLFFPGASLWDGVFKARVAILGVAACAAGLRPVGRN